MRGLKQCEPYGCPILLPWQSFQAVKQGGESRQSSTASLSWGDRATCLRRPQLLKFVGQSGREEGATHREKCDLQRVLLELQPSTDQHVHLRQWPKTRKRTNQMDRWYVAWPHGIRLEINNRKISEKSQNMWKLNTFLDNHDLWKSLIVKSHSKRHT